MSGVNGEHSWLSPRYKQLGILPCSAFVAILFVLPFPSSLFAQNQNMGEIRGTVTDSSGARVAGTKVAVTNTGTGITTTVVSGEAGFYDAPLLQAGPYLIKFSKEGFKNFVRRGITLHVETITVDAVLNVGSANQTVTVSADIPLIQTETSDRSDVFAEKTINALPNVGRDWFDILGQLPGVNPGGSSQDASGQSVGVNGAAAWQENWLVDGGVNTLPVSQNPAQMTPLDAIAEVDMTTSNFNAEFGSGVAVFNVITKSGTNQFHGSLYEFLQNNMFEARNYFAQTLTPLHWNMYGGTIGGPIRRDKAFFFFSYQSNPVNSVSPTFYTYPTAAMRAGDFSDPSLPIIYDPATYNPATGTRTAFPDNIIPANRIDPLAAKIQPYLPLPNLPGTGNNYYEVAHDTSTSISYNGKIDYTPSAANHLMGSTQFSPGNSFSPAPTCPMGTGSTSGCGNTSGMESQIQITDVWTFSPKLLNEARISFVREYGLWSSPDEGEGFPAKLGLQNPPANADVFPNIGTGGVASTSIGSGLFAVLGFNSFMESDSVTWLKGKHAFKFGGEFDRWQDNQSWSNLDSGDYDFGGEFTQNPADLNPPAGVGYADFLLGLPDSWGVAMQPLTGLRSWNLNAFAQDDYKVTPRLTLNLGLRYQRQAGWLEVENRIGNFDPTLLNPATGTLGAMCFADQTFGGHKCPRAQQQTVNLFQPRIGFAWSPKDTWSIRAAFGVFGMMQGGNNYTTGFAYGWSTQGSITSGDNLTPVFPFFQGPPPGSIEYPSAALRTPDGLNGEGVSYLPYNTPASYTQQWHLDIQHQILGYIGLDAAYVGSRGVHLLFGRDIDQVPAALLGPGNANLNRPYPQFQGIGANLYDGTSNYNSLQLSATTRVWHGLMYRVNFTYAKTLDESTTQGWSGNINESYQNAYDPHANYGPAAFDVRYLLNGNVVYELPFGQGKSLLNRGDLLNRFVGGWQLSSVFQAHSGLPFTPTMADNLTFSLAGSQYPNRVGKGTLAHPTINNWFDETAFVSPGLYKYGDSGRDILRGPGFWNVNLSLAKDFKIEKLGDQGNLQMRVDAYDVFNHPNFGMPDPNLGDGTTGIINSTAGSFANPGSRNLQLGAKLSF